MKEKMIVFLLLVSLLLSVAAMTFIPKTIGELLDAATNDGSKDKIDKVSVKFIGLFLIAAFFTFVRIYYSNLLGEKVTISLR